ncbi:MAG: hypothetical protein JRH19_09190, partial [Deltaproteobacteria bacterium]|nr:hypothetical protein [Deltaproteobacteria bacterium]
LGGEGFLYAYEPETDIWTVIASLRNQDLSDIAFDRDDDLIVGISERLELFAYDSTGHLVSEIRIDPEELPGIRDATRDHGLGHAMNIAIDHPYAAIAVTPPHHEPNDCIRDNLRFYVYDMDRDVGGLTWKGETAPESSCRSEGDHLQRQSAEEDAYLR